MKIKEIYVEVKKSMNFQTYTCGETITLNEGDNAPEIRANRMAVCRKVVMEQIELDKIKK